MTTSSKYYILRIKQGHRFDFKDFGFPVEDSLIKIGTDVRVPGIRYFCRALGFGR